MSKKGPDLSVALIGAPHDGDAGGDDGASGGDDAKEAMQAFIDAVATKDVEAALSAFGALYDMHDAAEPDDGEEG